MSSARNGVSPALKHGAYAKATLLPGEDPEEFKKLPGGIYSTSYIRQYARAIDFDESQILALYYSVMGLSAEAEEVSRRPSESNGNLVSRLLRHTSAVLGSST